MIYFIDQLVPAKRLYLKIFLVEALGIKLIYLLLIRFIKTSQHKIRGFENEEILVEIHIRNYSTRDNDSTNRK